MPSSVIFVVFLVLYVSKWNDVAGAQNATEAINDIEGTSSLTPAIWARPAALTISDPFDVMVYQLKILSKEGLINSWCSEVSAYCFHYCVAPNVLELRELKEKILTEEFSIAEKQALESVFSQILEHGFDMKMIVSAPTLFTKKLSFIGA